MRILVFLLFLITFAFASCSRPTFEGGRQILLFNGAGTSANDVKAIENILNSSNLSYSKVDSDQLNDMTESQLLTSQLLIIPGGNFIEVGNGLLPETSAKVHSAVERGLNYLGICAGAILAGHGDDKHFNLTSGSKFE